jgi:hypothetical protein
MEPSGRDAGGKFAPGNPGGPGRPRRAVEREYLAQLAEACPPETWRQVCQRAVDDARAGDAKARDWLAKYLLGAKPLGLLALAADEADAFTPEKEVALEQRVRQQTRFGKQFGLAWADRGDLKVGSGQR